jgi:hypothetical protein
MTTAYRIEREERAAAQRAAATAAFIEQKAEFDRLIAELADASDHHFGVDPDTLNWADRDGLARLVAKLTEIKNIIRNEGEYAL